MLTLIRRGRRRIFYNQLLLQCTYALSTALGALILLLLLGTQILSWYWLILMPAVAAAIGFEWARRRTPSVYVTAQLLDHRLSLADALSTALYFSQHQDSRSGPEVRRCQFEQAQQLSQNADLRRAIPYTLPRGIYLMAALALVASSLFALRYGLSRKLDLKPPLARMIQDQFGLEHKTELAKNVNKRPEMGAPPEEDLDRDAANAEPQSAGEPKASDRNDPQDPSGEKAEKRGNGPGNELQKQAENGQKSGDSQDAEGDSQADANDGQNKGNGEQATRKSGQSNEPAGQRASNSNESNSLLSKMKDAVQNLLSRMKPQQGNTGSQQSSMEQSSKQAGKGQPSGSKQQKTDPNGQKGATEPGESPDDQAGESAQNSTDPQGKGAGKSDSKQSSKQPGSGAGSQDGDKRLKQAEQLAAMGKISEILGKRSANISGEATVEVQTTTQTLHTPYARREAQHAQGGAEINRDEIPVALQNYVEQYFEQVRKQQPAGASRERKGNSPTQ